MTVPNVIDFWGGRGRPLQTCGVIRGKSMNLGFTSRFKKSCDILNYFWRWAALSILGRSSFSFMGDTRSIFWGVAPVSVSFNWTSLFSFSSPWNSNEHQWMFLHSRQGGRPREWVGCPQISPRTKIEGTPQEWRGRPRPPRKLKELTTFIGS